MIWVLCSWIRRTRSLVTHRGKGFRAAGWRGDRRKSWSFRDGPLGPGPESMHTDVYHLIIAANHSAPAVKRNRYVGHIGYGRLSLRGQRQLGEAAAGDGVTRRCRG